MNKIFLFCCVSMVCETNMAQNLPWLLPPSPTYKDVTPFSGGLSVVKKEVRKEDRFYFLDNQMQLSKDDYLAARPVSHGLACVYEKSKTGYWWRYRKGEFKRFGEYEKNADFQNNLAAVRKQGKWGFINTNGEEQMDAQYDGVRSFENNSAGVLKDGNVLIINSLGESKKIPYKQVHEFSEGLAAVWNKNNDIGYVDSTGQTAIPVQKGRKYAGNFIADLAAVSDTLPHLAFINKAGKKVFWFKNGTIQDLNHGVDQTDENMYKLHPFADGLAAVRQLGKWGYINTDGNMAIPFEYDAATRFSEGFAAVKKEGKWLYINHLGEVVRTGDFIEAKPCTEGMAWVKTAAGWGVLAITERLSIVLDSPFKNGATHENIKLHAKIISHSPLLSAEWVLNGQIIQKQFPTGTLNTVLEEGMVLKTGKNVLKLTVLNEKDVKTYESVIHYQPTTNAPIRYYSVMVANNDYHHGNWASLAGTPEHPSSPIADANALATVLLEKYQFEAILIVQNATLEQMKATLEDLTFHEDAAERILFFYAGHGDFDAVQKKAYLVPTDAKGTQRKTQLSASHFSNQVNTMQSEHILTIIDACYGGSFVLDQNDSRNTTSSKLQIKSNSEKTRSKTAWNRGAGVGKKTLKDSTSIDPSNDLKKKEVIPSNRPEPKDLETSEFLRAREVISSGQRIEVPNASDFIQVTLEELRQNTDSKIAARTLFERLKPDVMTKGLVPQHGILPSAGSDGGDFIFRKK